MKIGNLFRLHSDTHFWELSKSELRYCNKIIPKNSIVLLITQHKEDDKNHCLINGKLYYNYYQYRFEKL